MTKMVDEYISKMKDGRSFSSNQIDFVNKFDRNLDIMGLSQSTRYSRIQRLFQVFETIGKDFEETTEIDVENFIYNKTFAVFKLTKQQNAF